MIEDIVKAWLDGYVRVQATWQVRHQTGYAGPDFVVAQAAWLKSVEDNSEQERAILDELGDRVYQMSDGKFLVPCMDGSDWLEIREKYEGRS